ncbi:hypothetical protein L0244_23115 [bacterium]|nr:hypothetical protein [bacterium]
MIWLLASLPFLILIFFIVRYCVEVPQADEWSLVPLIDKSYQGTLHFKDLWALHNEHRLFFPRLLLLQIIRISHWKTLYELFANVSFAAISFFAIFSLIKKIQISSNKTVGWLVPLLSLMVFSLNQSENWFFGWNVQIYMNITAVLFGLILIGAYEFSWPRMIFAAILGIIATYSFANGFLFWPLGLLLLWYKRKSINRSTIVFTLWILIATISFVSYLQGYTKPAEHPSPLYFLQEPLSALNYFFAYLGSPLLAFCKKAPAVSEWLSHKGFSVPEVILWIMNHAASFAGVIGVILFCLSFRRLNGHQNWNIFLIFFAMAGYVLLSAILSTIARAGLGVPNALSLRYITISIWFWIPLTIIYACGTQVKFKSLFLSLLTGCLILNSIYGAFYSIKVHSYLMPARSELLRLQDENLLKRLYPDVEYIRKSVAIMQRYHLSVFRGDHRSK